MKIKHLFMLIFFCWGTASLMAQAKGKKHPKKTKEAPIVWYKYDISEMTTDISAQFPIPYNEKVQNDKRGRTHIISANDSLNKTYYAVQYTLHKTPIARIEAKELAQVTFDTFLSHFPDVSVAQQTDYIEENIEGVQTSFTDPKSNMTYLYRTFMYGNLQFQVILAHPYNAKQDDLYKTFLSSVKVKE
jgi:hypothetical protein